MIFPWYTPFSYGVSVGPLKVKCHSKELFYFMNSDIAAKTGRGAAWKSGLVFFRINWISYTFIPLPKGYFVNSSNCDFSRHFMKIMEER